MPRIIRARSRPVSRPGTRRNCAGAKLRLTSSRVRIRAIDEAVAPARRPGSSRSSAAGGTSGYIEARMAAANTEKITIAAKAISHAAKTGHTRGARRGGRAGPSGSVLSGEPSVTTRCRCVRLLSPDQATRRSDADRHSSHVDVRARGRPGNEPSEGEERNAVALEILDEGPPLLAVRVHGNIEGVPMIEPQAVVHRCLAQGAHGQRAGEPRDEEAIEGTTPPWASSSASPREPIAIGVTTTVVAVDATPASSTAARVSASTDSASARRRRVSPI